MAKDQINISLPIDQWHYQEFRDERHDQNYVEWKYFNFISENYAGYIIYYILDPEQKTWRGGGRLLFRVFRLSDTHARGAIHKIPTDKITIDSLNAGIDMNGSKITQTDSHHYTISGTLDEFSWNLNYLQNVPAIESFTNINPGVLRWEKFNWLIKMPRARVQGKFSINQEEFSINGVGYTDTNWGEMSPLVSTYEWGQFNGKDISFVFGYIHKLLGNPHTFFYVVLGKEVYQMKNAHFSIQPAAWRRDDITRLKIPSKNNFFVSNDKLSLEFSSETVCDDILALKISRVMPKSILTEHVVRYRGTLKKEGQLITEFDGLGFYEWSTKSWKWNFPISF